MGYNSTNWSSTTINSTNWTPFTIGSTNWNKNSSLPAGIKANDMTVTANSLTVFATGYTSLTPGNFTENIPSTNWTKQVI